MTLHGTPSTLNLHGAASSNDYLLLRSTVSVPASTGGRLDVSAPFTMTGRLNVMGGAEVIDLFGEGTATLRLDDSNAGWHRASDPGILYAFSNSSPLINPEPTSAVLLSTGAAWLLRRTRRSSGD
jgi:hypothetical protein